MQISITVGTGEGPTPLAAFDAALLNAGVANYNLIILSSIIPPGSSIQRTTIVTPAAEYGDRHYVVMARGDADLPGTTAWAGIGWVQELGDGRGLFVELHGTSKTCVLETITATLESMMASRGCVYGPIQHQIIGVECRDRPVCALVIALYKSEGWA
jgi:arginine decarboxylase